ncbi:MAG: hypothetical protein AAF889_07390, partial [Cyanobacteria bacterium P01_D01_bin.73]
DRPTGSVSSDQTRDISIVPSHLDYGPQGPKFRSEIAIIIGQPISTRACQQSSAKATSRRILNQLQQEFKQIGALPSEASANEIPMSVA